MVENLTKSLYGSIKEVMFWPDASLNYFFLFVLIILIYFIFKFKSISNAAKNIMASRDANIGGLFSNSYYIYFIALVVVAVGFVFGVNDKTAYWTSAFVFFAGAIVSYKSSQVAGFDSALLHFKEVVIGSVNIGLMSIKKLSDNPPEEIAFQTTGSLYFLGIAGEKFIKKCMDGNDFFKRNKTPQNIRFLLMDPFSDDMKSLSGDLSVQNENRRKIIRTLCELSSREKTGYQFEVRLYPKVPPLRLMISDGRVAALSVYTSNESGWRNSQLIFDSKNCPDSLAPYFTELFNDLWERGLNINLNVRADALQDLYCSDNKSLVDYGMVHGRFQGFHHEHLEYVLYGISHSKKCYIGITRPNLNEGNSYEKLPHRNTAEGNPYSYEERKSMIVESLRMLGVSEDRYQVIPFNVDNITEAVQGLNEVTVNEFNGGDASGNIIQFMKLFSPWEKEKKSRFEKLGFEVQVIRNGAHEQLPKNVTGTMVRELIASNRNWRDSVAPGTRRVLDAKPKEMR